MKKENLLLLIICVGIVVVMMSYTLIAPFVPGELLRRGIDPFYNGVILSCYSVISMLMSPFIASYFIPKFKYFRLFLLGIAITGTSMIAYGLCYFISNNSLFIAANIIIRMIQGTGMALTFQVGITVLAIVFKDRISKVAPIRMMAGNIGIAIGPSLGGLLYNWLGYIGPFLFIGSLILVIFFIFLSLISSDSIEQIIVKGEAQQDSKDKIVSYCTFCKIKMSLMGLIGMFLTFQFIVFYEPILADRLQIDFGYDSDQVAYFFSIYTVSAFLIGSILIFFSLKSHYAQWASFALTSGLIALILMGPSGWLGLPDNQILIGIGFFMLSVATQFLRVSSLVLILNSMRAKHPGQIHRISKLLGAYNEIIIGLSFLITPLYSSAIYKAFGYEAVCNILAVLVLAVLIMLVIVTLIVQREERQQQEDQRRARLLQNNIEQKEQEFEV